MDNGAAMLALTIPAGDRPALVFTRYENGYRLSAIWESDADGFALTGRSDAARVRRAEVTPAASEAQTIVLAANWK
jgi:hypothetical protein